MSVEPHGTVLPTYPQPSPTDKERALRQRVGDHVEADIAGREVTVCLVAVESRPTALEPDLRLHVRTSAGEWVVGPSALV